MAVGLMSIASYLLAIVLFSVLDDALDPLASALASMLGLLVVTCLLFLGVRKATRVEWWWAPASSDQR